MKKKLTSAILGVTLLLFTSPLACNAEDEFKRDLRNCNPSQHSSVTIHGPKNGRCRVTQPNGSIETDFRTNKEVKARDCNYPVSILPDFVNNLTTMDKTITTDFTKYKKSLAKILDYELKYCKQ